MGRSHSSQRTAERFTAIKTLEAAAMDRFTSTTKVCHQPLKCCPKHFTDIFFKETIDTSAMNPVQFCLQPDNTFVVRNLGNDKNDPSDDANIVQMCSKINTLGPYTIDLYTVATATSPYCQTIRLQLAPDPPVFPTGCPSSTIPIPTDQTFRVRSSRLETWLLGPRPDQLPEATLTPNVNDATLFTVSEGSSDRIGYYYATVSQQFEAYYEGEYGQNSGHIDFGPNGQGKPPVLFCLQPDNTFTLFSVGDDGQQTEVAQNSDYDSNGDPTIAVTCPQEDGSVYSVFIDNGGYLARNPDGPCYPDTLVYEPAVAPTPGACVPLPTDVPFRIRSLAQQTVGQQVWLLANIDVQGTMATTSDINLATRFQPADDGTDQIYTFRDNEVYYSAFAPYSNNEDSGYIRLYPDPYARIAPAVTFCVRGDNSLGVYSTGEDGPDDGDPRFVLTCPNRKQEIILDDGSYTLDPACKRDTLYYEALPPLVIPDPQT